MPDPTSPTKEEIEEKMADILARIAKEQKSIDALKAIRLATKNADVLRKTDAEEREARKSLEYFHSTLEDLKQKRDSLARNANNYPGGGGSRFPGGYGGAGGYGANDHERPLPAPPHDGPNDSAPRARQYSSLGENGCYIHMAEDLMLEFKLQVERQYQKGFDLMQRAYTADGDKKSRQDAQNQKIESDKTIQLLSSALRRYKNLHVIEVAEEEDAAEGPSPANPIGDRKGNLRKPLTGTLQITVKAARELEHAPLTSSKKSSKSN
ncbi:3509_t:CDS:2, partial [Acaulospora colombiana]